MSPSPELVVEAAKSEDLPRIENLMQFYNYDMSQWLPVSFGESGLYSISSKRDYWVSGHRPALDIEAVATGERLYGSRALELKLVDAIETSDDYLQRAAESSDLYRISYRARRTLQQRVLSAIRYGADEAAAWLSQREQDGRFP